MPVERLKLEQLTEAEQADLQAALRDPRRFHSDGREIMLTAAILPLLLLPLWFVLLNEITGTCGHEGPPWRVCDALLERIDAGVLQFLQNEFPIVLGLVLMPVFSAGIVSYALRTRGRHGHAITGFGLVRIRGTALRVLRYADIAEVCWRSRRLPQHRINTDELEVRSRKGGSITMYGFGLEERARLIEAQRVRFAKIA